jgi:uncharacterized membrane protein YdjX (TVP38/TMEM64 family)
MDVPFVPDRVFESETARRDALVRVGAVVGVFVGSLVLVQTFAPHLTDPEWIQAAVGSLGPYAGVTFVAVQAAQVVFAPIPGQALGLVGGYLFGALAGTAYSMVGVVVGSTLVFVLARRYGRPYVERVVDDDVLDRFDSFVERRGVFGLFVVFLLPTFPDDAICALAGLTTLRIRTLVALVAVGRLPTFLLVTYAGEGFADGRLFVAVGVLVSLTVASVGIYAARERLDSVR